jgi:hypothetical protein
MAIVSQVSDIKTLSALVHASPRLHAVYSAVRESVLTKTILRELGTEGSPFDIKAFLKPADVYCLYTTNKTLDPNLQSSVKTCQIQHSKAVDIILNISQCAALRTIVFYHGWSIVEGDGHSRPKSHTMMCSNSAVSLCAWRQGLRVADSYGFHVITE